ncbi:DUF748 domain-containing protein [Burkholderia sp. Ac-20379]|uniref:DUF748 domain-containing protein n=1 Tax=Burkholderia sp. Ac-20379 TaxID=2703900 RepID=UPI0019806AEA|nr:DUF748 domain-containing protein [Burkholderia sp. Ac-20379]MBN3722844.1 DUF748 domain-containing protein [Burkholderia sp. Ac-20379]
MSSIQKNQPKAPRSSVAQRLGGVARSRRTKRVAIGIVAFLIVFGLLGFFAAPPLIRHVAEQQLSRQLDRPASIARIALNPYTLRLEADGVHIGERGGQGPFVDIGKLTVRPAWSSLLRGAPIVDEVRIDAPRFHIVRYDAQRFNFSDIVDKFSKPSAPSSSGPTRFSVSNIQVTNGRIDFDDRLLGAAHTIDQWSLGVPFVATLPSKTDIFVQPTLKLRLDGSPIAIDGRTKPFAQSRESEINLKFDGLDVPKLLSYSPVKLPVAVTSGRLSSDLAVRFSIDDKAPALRVSGTVDLADANVTDPAGRPLFAARQLHLAAASLEPLRNVLHFSEIRVAQPVVTLSRDAAGVLNVQKLAASEPGGAAHKPAASPASAASAAAVATQQAAKPQPLDLTIARLAIDDGTIHVSDAAVSPAAALTLANLKTTLAGFTLQGRQPAKFWVSTTLAQGGAFSAAGAFSLAQQQAGGHLTLDALALPALAPYLSGATSAKLIDGKLGASVDAFADWSKAPFAANVGPSRLTLSALKVGAPYAKAPVLALQKATVNVQRIDVGARDAQIASVDVNGFAVDAARLKNGEIDLASLAAPTKPARPVPAAANEGGKSAAAAAAPWHYRIGELNLTDSKAGFTDLSTPHPVKLALAPLQVKVGPITDDLSKPLPLSLRTTLNRKGTFAVTGDVTATPLNAHLRIDGNRLDAAAFEPYFGGALNATIASALLNANGNLAVSQNKAATKAAYRGDVALVDVRMLDKATSDPFAGWRSLALSNLKANYDSAQGVDVDAARVTFANFYGRVLLDAQGRLNLSDVVAKQTGPAQSLTRDASGAQPVALSPGAAKAASATASAVEAASAHPASDTAAASNSASAPLPASAPAIVKAAEPPSQPVRMRFGELVLQGGRVTYTDNFIKPNYTADLVDIQGTVGAFGTESRDSAPVDVAASLEGNGPISIKGSVNPLIAKPALDLTASAHGIELTNLTPYSTKYAGYPITKGKLNVDLHYQLADDQLSANNHIFIDQLTFGDHIDNDTATRLPVRLAISLLKNSRGEIDVNIPVSGSLSSPEFSVGGLIWHAVLNLLKKAVTAPFSLLASAFGGNGEELGYVEFAPGLATLTDASKQKLDTISKLLAQKPSIRLDLTGRVDPARDLPGLREAYVERLVRVQKLKGVVGQGESVDPMTVKVAPDEYLKYLTEAYKAADFKKPRNLIGMQKTLPEADMRQALEAHAPADDAGLRALAQQRAQAVRQYLDGKVDPGRMFIVAPKLDAKGIEDKGATTRVDFGLK